MDVQIEQSTDFLLDLRLTKEGGWNLDSAVFEAYFSHEAAQRRYTLTVTKTGGEAFTVSFPAASSLAIGPTTATIPLPVRPQRIGRWVLNITDAGRKRRLVEGDMYMSRMP
jgi:hypothetical protein